MPRAGPQRPTTAPQLRLAITRVLGEDAIPTFPSNPHYFQLPLDEYKPWLEKSQVHVNWRCQVKRIDESKRKPRPNG